MGPAGAARRGLGGRQRARSGGGGSHLKSLSLDVIFSSRLEMWYEALAMLMDPAAGGGRGGGEKEEEAAASSRPRRLHCAQCRGWRLAERAGADAGGEGGGGRRSLRRLLRLRLTRRDGRGGGRAGGRAATRVRRRVEGREQPPTLSAPLIGSASGREVPAAL